MAPFDTLLEELDPDQRAAVLHDGGPLLIVAGAGAGKTRVIVGRIVRLLRDGATPASVAGITFTNRAAGEMRDRVARALDGLADPPWLGTFHAFGALLLRRFGGRLGVPPRFLIYDDRDREELLRQVLKEKDIDEKRFPAARFASVIERAKRDGSSIEAAALAAGWLFVGKAEEVARGYEEALAAAGAVDFADLIRLPVALLRQAPDVLATVRSEVRHLLVDEFQDVDPAQAELARRIGSGAESFCAVGDEDQSIYGWRGGSAGPMHSFERDNPGAAVLHLATNYRSRAAILSAAGAVIRKNRARRDKPIVAALEGGDRPVVRLHEDADDEARGTADAVAGAIRRGVRPEAIAVFYRVNAQSRPLEDALRRLEIPYVLRGALSFYDRAAVRDALAYLRWFTNPEDAVALRRLLRAPRRGIGDAGVARAKEASRLAGQPWIAALEKIPALGPLFGVRERWLAGLPKRRVGEAFRDLLTGAGYLDWIAAEAARDPGAEDREKREEMRENVDELLRLADAFEGTGEDAACAFLETVSLSPRENGRDGEGSIRLMTLHNAKGLEFDEVFLVGVEEGLLPHSRSAGDESEVEEERRLFYVGLTRARERVTLSFVRRRPFFGERRDALPSRFLSEIPPALLDRGGIEFEPASFRRRVARAEARRTVPSRPGMTVRVASPADRSGIREDAARGKGRTRSVRHPVFGEGSVERFEGEGDERKVVARFPGHGVRKILIRAVRMEFLD